MTEQAEAITLTIKPDPQGQADSVTPLEWCISPETVQLLQDKQAVDPYLLIVTSHNLEEVDRYLVPLKARKTWVEFRHPGANVVHATVVWRNGVGKLSDLLKPNASVLRMRRPVVDALNNRLITLENKLWCAQSVIRSEQAKRPAAVPEAEPEEGETDELAARRRKLVVQIAALETELDELGKIPDLPNEQVIAEQTQIKAALLSEIDQLSIELAADSQNPVEEVVMDINPPFGCLGSEAQLEVNVPASMFAKASLRLTRWLGKKYHWPRPARDQCDLRRRAVFTAATLPLRGLAILIMLLVDLAITGVLVLAGMRGIDFSVLRHPLRDVPSYLWAQMEPSFWFKQKSGVSWPKYQLRPPAYWFINPPALLAFAAIGAVLAQLFDQIILVLAGIGAALALSLVALVVQMATRGSIKRRREASQHDSQRLQDEAEARMRQDLARRLQHLLCSEDQRPQGFLPRQRRTAYIYHAAKARVCKPFVGS